MLKSHSLFVLQAILHVLQGLSHAFVLCWYEAHPASCFNGLAPAFLSEAWHVF
jgi:hypothetical protein